MNRYFMQTCKTDKNELNEMGEGLEAAISVVDWSGTGGRDILYNLNPRFFGGGTYLYKEDRKVVNTIPIYHPAEVLEGLKGHYCIPLKTHNHNRFNILMLEEECIVLYRNTGTKYNPVFGESKEKVSFSGKSLNPIISKDISLFSVHSFNKPGSDVTDIIITCTGQRKTYWPDGRSPWGNYEHPNAGFGRGYDKNEIWKGNKLNIIIYMLKNTGTNENPIFESYEEIYSFNSMDLVVDATLIDIDRDGQLEMVLRMNVDKLYMLKLDERLKPEGVPVEMKCSPLKRVCFRSSFFPCDINGDGRIDILVTGNPGTVFWLENMGDYLIERPPLLKRGGDVRVETLSVPCFADMDNDGDMDLIIGDSSGYLWYFENIADILDSFVFKAGKRIKANEKEICHQAGYSGSIQGPVEKRWGYVNPLTVDWDEDGLIDIITNDITGKIKWYRNIGTKNRPVFDKAITLMCDDKEFVTAWRSRPAMWDNSMLVAINIDGFAQFFIKDERDYSIVHEGRLLRYVDGCAIKCCGQGGHLGRTVLYSCDWDGDGITDIIGGTHRDLTESINVNFPRKATVFWLKNVGTNSKPVFERPRLITLKDGTPIDLVCHKCSPWCIDIDGDGELDIASGAEDGKVYMWFRKELKWDWEPSVDFNDNNSD